VLLLSCGAPQVVGSTDVMTVPPTRSFDGTPSRVDLLARGFLAQGKQARPGFAYYGYLIFADRAAASLPARRAAAIAYLRLLDDVKDAPRRVEVERLAVLYAPVVTQETAEDCRRTRDPQALLDGYDYQSARLVYNSLKRSGAKVPSVALVGYPRPLEAGASYAEEELYVVDLSEQGGERVESRLLEFRESLETGDGDASQGMPVALVKAKAFFKLVGLTLADLKNATVGHDT
jgi:hypothetical protein